MKLTDIFIQSAGSGFNFEGFERAGAKLFSKAVFPQVTLKHGSLVFNAHAVKTLDECSNIQILINMEKKSMVVKPCGENIYHSVQWSKVGKNSKVIPKIIYAKPFTGQLFYDMYWDFKGTVRILGRQIKDRNEKMLEFKLGETL